MARLLDLPDELLSAIIAYLHADSTATTTITQRTLPFHRWAEMYHRVIEQIPSLPLENLRSLLLVCRRLNRFVKPIFYHDICIRDSFPKNRLDDLQWTLEKDPSLREHIFSVVVPCSESILEAYPFFWFPNIEQLSILKFNDWEPLLFHDDSHIGTSPVRVLHLIACGAHEEALAAVLSWPAALAVLHYDTEQGEWGGHYEGQPVYEWTCAAFVRTLQPQKATLRELTLTRPPLVHEGLGNGPRIDLTGFNALVTLRIYHVFLCGVDDRHEAWRALPRSLEVLEVFYDDTDLTQFRDEGDSYAPDPWLLALVRHKRMHLPYLRSVSINSPECIWDSDREEELPAGPWTPPSSVTSEFAAAGVKLDVWIGYVDPPDWKRMKFPQVLERPRKRCRFV